MTGGAASAASASKVCGEPRRALLAESPRSPSRELGEGARMPRFVQADLASAWDPEPCHQAVPLVGDRRDELDALLAQLGDRSFKVVAHEKEFVLPVHPPPARARMDGELGRR